MGVNTVVNRLVLKNPPTCKPLSEWGTVAVELIGTQTRLVTGERFTHRVIECGSGGEPLILIHGIGGHAEAYVRNLRNLADHGFHVYAIDALYCGYSTKTPQAATIDERTGMQADALADLVRALGHDYAHIEGESMGAAIAYEFGLRYPELTGKVVMNTGFPIVELTRTDFKPQQGGGPELMRLSQQAVTDPSFEMMRSRMEWLVAKPEYMTDEMVEIRRRIYADPEIQESMKYIYQIGKEWEDAVPQPEESVQNFTHETLVLWTENNPGVGPDVGEYFSTLLPKGSFYEVRDAGHWAQWEKPEEHDQVLIEFILGVS